MPLLDISPAYRKHILKEKQITSDIRLNREIQSQIKLIRKDRVTSRLIRNAKASKALHPHF